ncbi:EH signature domain-containing protein [uncultured Sphingomonas sp.]|uniref:EH signature domain-containing protein n=1 Tax=uncultured Sphingomonas sp. TaxID=158754 RepID=UPI00260EFC50|nr:EH signature domain-containing protein [uncultured Sphingomonas sp.]
MSALKELLSEPKALLSRLSVKAPGPAALRKAVAAIEGEAMGDGDVEALAILQSRIAATVRGGGVGRLSRRDLREGCKAFLLPPDPPGREPDLRDALIGEVRSLERRAAFFALIDSYIDAFDEGDEDIAATAEQLALAARAWRWREGDHWPTDIAALDLFAPARAPAKLADLVLGGGASPLDVLNRWGLATPGRRKGGLVTEAFIRACRAVSRLRGREAVDGQRRLIGWARDESGALAYARAWPDLVDACLTPWTTNEPDNEHKVHLIETLERFGGGDPRVRPERWRSVVERFPDAYGLLLRWLTRASVLQFLDIVDRSLRESDVKRMWSYRRAFWTSYLMGTGGGPQIDAAWVAFGDDGARLATQAARESGDRSFAAFGRQEDKSPQHAALIVRIGDLTIVDWSHNAKYNVWRKGEKGVPALFKQAYRLGELYSAPLQESHSAPANYAWQKKLARIIEGRTFWTEKPEWRPRRV